MIGIDNSCRGMKKRVTLKDIAEELNVSVTTISKAINNHPDISTVRRQQVIELLEKRNYIPNYMAKNLRGFDSKFIGLIVSDNTNPYYAMAIKGVESVLSKHGFFTLIFNTNEQISTECNFVREMLGIGIAGVLITPAMGNTESLDILSSNSIPYVCLHRYASKGKGPYVVADDVEAAYLGTKYLLEKYKRPVILINASRVISTAQNRFEGYCKALSEEGLAFNPELVIENVITQSQGYETAKELIKKVRKNISIICYSDYVATGVIMCLIESNIRIPQDITLVGIDGISMFSYIYPGLTTVHLPKFELGAIGAELLLNLINGQKEIETKISLKPALHIMGTA